MNLFFVALLSGMNWNGFVYHDSVWLHLHDRIQWVETPH